MGVKFVSPQFTKIIIVVFKKWKNHVSLSMVEAITWGTVADLEGGKGVANAHPFGGY